MVARNPVKIKVVGSNPTRGALRRVRQAQRELAQDKFSEEMGSLIWLVGFDTSLV